MAKKRIRDETIIEKNITSRCGGFSFRVRMTASGARIDETFDTIEEARAFRDRKRADLATDPTARLVLKSREAKREAARLTLDGLLTRYEDEITPTKKGKRAELLRIAKLRRFPISRLPVQLLDRTALLNFMNAGKKDESWSDSTLRKYLMLISGVFTTAIKRWGHAIDNPVQAIEVPSNGTARTRRLLPTEYDYLLDAMKQCRNKYIAPLFVLAVETAARRGELLKLDWNNVDLDEGTAVLLDTKNNEDRVIPLSKRARQVLRDMQGKSSGRGNRVIHLPANGKVFRLEEHQARSGFEFACKRALKRYLAECQEKGVAADPAFLTDLRFHDLRHEATTRLFERGLDIMEASSVTGHKTLSMLKRYTHLRARDLVKKLG